MTFFIAVFFVLIDVITILGIRKVFPEYVFRHWQTIRKVFIVQAAIIFAILLGGVIFQRITGDYRLIACYYYIFGFVSAICIVKTVYVLFLYVDWLVLKTFERFGKILQTSRHIIAKSGLWTSPVFLLIFVWGTLFGRYNFTLEHVEISSDNLPQAFNGYKIVQISDIHTGSFAGFAQHFQKATEMINGQNPDLIVMTGDLVNNFADETAPFIPVFSQLNARDGKYAILGNHDYGGYYEWKNIADSVANHKAIKGAIMEMGFVLLNNQSVTVSRNNTDSIAIIGVENWSKKGKKRPRRGDLEKAMKPVRDMPFKILLSHDPSLWTEKVAGKTDITLTLAGHTHGMQIGVKLGKRRYNPLGLIRFRYLAGLYQKEEQYLYINRGLGVIGLPARIGMPPEITVITLRKDKPSEN